MDDCFRMPAVILKGTAINKIAQDLSRHKLYRTVEYSLHA